MHSQKCVQLFLVFVCVFFFQQWRFVYPSSRGNQTETLLNRMDFQAMENRFNGTSNFHSKRKWKCSVSRGKDRWKSIELLSQQLRMHCNTSNGASILFYWASNAPPFVCITTDGSMLYACVQWISFTFVSFKWQWVDFHLFSVWNIFKLQLCAMMYVLI